MEQASHNRGVLLSLMVVHICFCVAVTVDRCWTETLRPQLCTTAESESTWLHGMDLTALSSYSTWRLRINSIIGV